MSTCTDLINAINEAVVLAEVSSSDIAVLSSIGTTETAVQLNAGGAAVLSLPSSPSISGKALNIIVAGLIHSPNADSFAPGIYVGTSTTLGSNQGLFTSLSSFSQGVDFGFLIDMKLIWDSVSQKIQAYAHISGSGQDANALGTVTGISAQTSLQFVLSGKFSASNASNSLTVTEFQAKYL